MMQRVPGVSTTDVQATASYRLRYRGFAASPRSRARPRGWRTT